MKRQKIVRELTESEVNVKKCCKYISKLKSCLIKREAVYKKLLQ